jgi:hypothetical protein
MTTYAHRPWAHALYVLATSVFNYAGAFDGDLSACDVSVVIHSAGLKSIVYIG